MSSEPHTIRLPAPIWQAFEILHRTEGTPQSQYDSLNAAAVSLFVYHVAFHKRKHTLTGGMARMRGVDRDLICEYLLHAVKAGIDLQELLPKPAMAEELLRLAKEWKSRRPQK